MLRILGFWIVLRPCAIWHKFRLYTGFTRAYHVHVTTLLRIDPEFLLSGPFWQPACAFRWSAPATRVAHAAPPTGGQGHAPIFLLLVTAFCCISLFFSALISTPSPV